MQISTSGDESVSGIGSKCERSVPAAECTARRLSALLRTRFARLVLQVPYSGSQQTLDLEKTGRVTFIRQTGHTEVHKDVTAQACG